jgi:hypothetical protein
VSRVNAPGSERLLGRRKSLVRAGVFGALAAFIGVACTGENIFPTGVIGGGGGGNAPAVEITQPAADAAVNVGDSVQVQASIISTNGVNQVTIGGSFESGGLAFVQQVLTLSLAADTTISQFLQLAGATTGAASIVVEARDVLGNTGADTVAVTIN